MSSKQDFCNSKNENVKVSIVVPIYNTATYLERCFKSICSQTYQNLEIILIDDGSTDESLELCNMAAQKDSRIRVFHQENMGLSRTRNKGMQLATGKFIAFIDSDDYIDPFMIETMLHVSLKTNTDICECGMYVHRPNGNICTFAFSQNNPIVINDLYSLIEAYTHGTIMIPAWNKLYKLSEIKNILFDPDCVREEADYTLKLCMAEKTFTIINNPFYHYIKRENVSLTGKKISPQLFTLQNWGETMRNQILTFGEEYQTNANIILYNSLVHILKHFIRDYKKGLLLKGELQSEIHLVVNRLLELFVISKEPFNFRDIDNVLKIVDELMMVGVLKKENLSYWNSFLDHRSLTKMEQRRKSFERNED